MAARNRSNTCYSRNPRSVDGRHLLMQQSPRPKALRFFVDVDRRKQAQMINWALDTISKEALWVLVVAAVIVVVAVVSRWR